ncbi:MAG TPA: histidinol-phosphate transaminase [Alphaproteobacteria bacterium]
MNALAPRPGILDIAAYQPGNPLAGGPTKYVNLASNESALGPSPRAREAYKAAAAELHYYPDGGSTRLRRAIGAVHGLDPDRIVCGAGSDELLTLLARGYAGPGDEILMSEHGFAMYPITTRSVGATPVMVPDRELTADVDGFLARVTPRTRLVFIANPNNPTGTMISADEMARLRAGLPDNVLLVVDSAYAEYVVRNDYSPGVELVDAGDNTVMTRTFSKIHGLAALRIGWAYCPPAIADVLNRLRSPFNVGTPAQEAGIAAIEDVANVDKARGHNDVWRPWFEAEVAKLGLKAFPSVANFSLVEFPADEKHSAKAAHAFMQARGILLRPVGVYGLPRCLRITIGTEAEMRTLVAALAEFLA